MAQIIAIALWAFSAGVAATHIWWWVYHKRYIRKLDETIVIECQRCWLAKLQPLEEMMRMRGSEKVQ